MTFLRNELLLAPYQSVYAYHAYSFTQTVVDNIDFIFDQNSSIVGSFCPKSLTYSMPYNQDILFLLSYCDTDYAPRLFKIQYNTLIYKVLQVWTLNLPEGSVDWKSTNELCNLNYEFSPLDTTKNKNGINTSLIFRNGNSLFEINPNNGYDANLLDVSFLNGTKNTSSRLFDFHRQNDAPSISRMQCLQGAVLVEFSNNHQGLITPTERGTYDWFGKFKARFTDIVSGSATLVQGTQILNYRAKDGSFKYLNLGGPGLIYDLSSSKPGDVLKLKGGITNGDSTTNITVNITVQAADEMILTPSLQLQ